jgi:RNA polymerase sigma factor (sigma-70 family)
VLGYSGYMAISDEQLMLNFANGDSGAFETLYGRHKGPLYRYILRQVNLQQAAAEEIFQEVWSSVIDSRKRYTPSARFATFLYSLAHNRTMDHFRRNAVRLVDPVDCDIDSLEGSAVDPARQVSAEDCVELLQALVQTLPNDQRQVFVLRHEGVHLMEEIAEIMASTLEATKSRLRYAVKKLRNQLVQEDCL